MIEYNTKDFANWVLQKLLANPTDKDLDKEFSSEMIKNGKDSYTAYVKDKNTNDCHYKIIVQSMKA